MNSFLVFTCIVFNAANVNGSCVGKICHTIGWSNWSTCDQTCSRSRQKSICCPDVHSQTLDTCLRSCNISKTSWNHNAVEKEFCNYCQSDGLCCNGTQEEIQTFHGPVSSENTCSSNLCRNGVCIAASVSYICVCISGFKGKYCETDRNDCLDDNCLYGKCVDLGDGFSCECNILFEGKTCSKMKAWAIVSTSVAALLVLVLTCCCLYGIAACQKKEDKRKISKQTRKVARPTPMTKLNAWMEQIGISEV